MAMRNYTVTVTMDLPGYRASCPPSSYTASLTLLCILTQGRMRLVLVVTDQLEHSEQEPTLPNVQEMA